MANNMEWKHSGTMSVFDAVDKKTNGLASDFIKTDTTNYVIQNAYEMAIKLNDLAQSNKHITIVGDYDADGICSTAELIMLLNELGTSNITVRLPHRISEGYGIKESIVDEIHDGAVISVDNGIAAIPAIQKAVDKCLETLIIDHHLPAVDADGNVVLPNADLIVDANVDDALICKGKPVETTFRGYCAAGVVYKIAQLLLPDQAALRKISSLAAIATIADIVDLTGDNRNIYHTGIDNISKGYTTAGTRALISKLYSDGNVSEGDIGFKIAPMLNAPGRIYDKGAEKGLNVVLCEDEQQAYNLVRDLSNDNDFRKREKSRAVDRAFSVIRANHMEHNNPIVILDPKTAKGIVGLVSGEITETYNQSSFVLTEQDGVYSGSGRAAEDDNLKEALDHVNAQDPDVFLGYGGHKSAAGITVRHDKLDDFARLITETMPAPHAIPNSIEYDLEITPDQLAATAAELDKFRPFGQRNPDLIVRVNNFKLMPEGGTFYKKIGEDSVKFKSSYGEAVGFSMLQDYHDLGDPKEVDLIGTISWHYFHGEKTPQIEIIDMKESIVNMEEQSDMQKSILDILQQNNMA